MTSFPDSLVESPEGLEEVLGRIGEPTDIPLDTEFMRVNTYTPQLALIQIAAGDAIFCIDPANGLDLSPLWEHLVSAEHCKIMHSAKQDYEAIYFALGKVPDNLFDTQIAAGLCGHPAQIGYAGLCNTLLGVELPKTQTRSDWLRRPLSPEQIHYAAEDVVHLGEIAERLRESLEQLGRTEWAREDAADMGDISLYAPAPEDAWKRIKSIPFMRPAQQALARALAQWREERAVQLDRPRSWILSDQAIRELVETNPADMDALNRCKELPPATKRKQGEYIVKLLQKTNAAVKDGSLRFEQQATPGDDHKQRVRQMAGTIKACADELGIAAEVLGSKRELNAIVAGDLTQRPLRGWRKELIGEQLLAELD